MTTDYKLPIGIQSFEDIRTNGYVYADKTAYIEDLIRTGKSYFLSRPRRFGKSLLVSTMEAYFEGKKDLFRGLAISQWEDEKGEDGWKEYPVISFYLSGGDYRTSDGLADRLFDTIEQCARRYQLEGKLAVTGRTLAVRFKNLIEKLYEKTGRQAVVLVDEYDKPLLDNIAVNREQEEDNRQLYKGFFSILKDEDRYLKFVFFTGVTKFSKVSVFSDLNQLRDISLSDDVSGICGITEKELGKVFRVWIQVMADKLKVSEEECIRELAKMYDGYRFSPEGTSVYNPFSLLNAFEDRRLRRYWYETGTPTFLLNKLRSSDFSAEQLAEGVDIDEQSLMDYRADNPDPIPLFYQTGYLTIFDYDEDFQIYSLRFPNNEVKYGFLNSLAPYVLGQTQAEHPLSARRMVQDLQRGDLDGFMRRVQALFAGVPYPEGKPLDYEKVWRDQIYIILTMLGLSVRCEVHSATGRADCIVETKDYVYVLEFKMDRPAQEALSQIWEKCYATPYAADSREVVTVGVSFSSEKRNVTEWVVGDSAYKQRI